MGKDANKLNDVMIDSSWKHRQKSAGPVDSRNRAIGQQLK